MALPNLPLQGQNPWYTQRQAWDTAVDSALQQADTQIQGLTTRANGVDSTLSGRLSTASLDARYTLKEVSPVAVFFGSSNVLPDTWTTQFCTWMGYTQKNYAVGGGSFTGSGAGAYSSQIAAAAADSALNKSTVKYVFLADMGNDARAQGTNANFQTAANTALNTLRNTFPNARIVIVPALWGITPGVTLGNLELHAIRALTQFSQTLKDLSLTYNMDFVENSHLWHYDSTAWMKPNEVHFTAAGYLRIAQMMREYMRAGSVPTMGVGTTPVTAKANVTSSNVLASRDGNLIRVTGDITVNTNLGTDADLFQLPEGVFPFTTTQVPLIGATSRQPGGTMVIFGAGNFRGLVRGFSNLNAGGYYLNFTLPAF